MTGARLDLRDAARSALSPVLDDPSYQVASQPEWEATIRLIWDGATYREERYAALASMGGGG